MKHFILIFILMAVCTNVFAPNLGTGGFGTTGIVIQDLGNAEEGQAGAYYSNGRLVVAGYIFNGSNNDFTAIRLFPDGTVDTSFGSNGQVTTDLNGLDDKAYSVTLDTLGRVLVAGETTTGAEGVNFGLVRYNTDGGLDTKFNTTGIVSTDFGGTLDDVGRSVAINSQNQIIIAGYRDAGSSDVDFALSRYMSNGLLDTKFASAGLATTPIIASQNDYIHGIYFRTNNGFMVVGYTGAGSGADFAIARYGSNGILDSTFASTVGYTTVDFASLEDVARDATFDGNNRLLVTGETHTGSNFDFAFVRLNSNGTLDSKFSSAGTAIRSCSTTQDDQGRGVVMFGSNNFLAVGRVSNGSNLDLCAMRLLSNGSLDANYDTDGIYTTDLSLLDDPVNGLAWDGSYYFGAIGGTTNASSGDFAVSRIAGNAGLAKAGDHNTYFWGSDGAGVGGLSFDISGRHDKANELDFQTDTKIVIVGESYTYNSSIARITPQGTLDTKYASDGIYEHVSIPWSDKWLAVKVNENNRALGGGRNVEQGMFFRMETNGFFDTKFAGGGAGLDPPNSVNAILYDAATNRGYYFGNWASDAVALTRFTSDGSWPDNYGSDGTTVIDLGEKNLFGELYDARFASGGTTLVCGPQACGGFVARVSTTGIQDTTFGSNGLLYISSQGVHNCNEDNNDHIAVVGEANGHCAVWRINSNGVLDTNFNTTGAAEIDWASGTDRCGGSAMQNGKIMVGGVSSDLNVFRYSRLLSDGSLDAPFHSNPGSDDDLFGGTSQDFSRVIVNDRDMLFIVGRTFASNADWAIQSVFP